MHAILRENSEWWETWRRKTAGTSGNIPLAQYATYALSDEGSPAALGVLVLGFGICRESEDADRYIGAVDRWVLSDDEYASTLEGMECIILEAKWYSDVGQPRRAWLAFRRGLMFAQLMVDTTLQCVAHHVLTVLQGSSSQAHYIRGTRKHLVVIIPWRSVPLFAAGIAIWRK
jgi:hypothetical protein